LERDHGALYNIICQVRLSNPFAPSKSTPKIGSQNWFLEIPQTKCWLCSKLITGPTFDDLFSQSLNVHEVFE